MTLGERMAEAASERQRRAQEAARQKSEMEARLEAETRLRFGNFLDKAVEGLRQDVEFDRTPTKRKIPEYLSVFVDGGFRVPNDDRHPLHDMWLDFVAKMAEDDVVPCLGYRHDEVGVQSSHVLTFSPALKALPTP